MTTAIPTLDHFHFADVLKERTAAAHRHAETRSVQKAMGGGTIDVATLAAYLGQLRLIHLAIEGHIDANTNVSEMIDWSDDMRHASRLHHDLEQFSPDACDAPPLDETASFLRELDVAVANDARAVLGAFYVLEGSMNGNRFLARSLSRRIVPSALTYFDPYGDQQSARWKAVRSLLNNVATSIDDGAAILGIADRTFDAVAQLSTVIGE